MLPVKKIYIDTKYKTKDSISNSNFKYKLPQTMFMPENTVFYVDDVAKAISSLIEDDQHERYLDLGGDETYTFKELIEILLAEIKRKRIILNIPFFLAKLIASTNDFFRLISGGIVPAFLTLAQVKGLENDNLVDSKSENFSDLGIAPKKLKII